MTEEVTLYFGESPEDREAVRIVVRARIIGGVRCALVGPVSDMETPRLRVGLRDVFGPEQIRTEISRFQGLPPPASEPEGAPTAE